MASLSNHSDAIEVLNLGWHADGHGPFLVRQFGRPSPDACPRPVEGSYVLLRDGTWLLNVKFCTLPEAEWQKHLHPTIADVQAALERLGSKTVVDCSLPEGITPDEMLARMANTAHEFLERKRFRIERKPD